LLSFSDVGLNIEVKGLKYALALVSGLDGEGEVRVGVMFDSRAELVSDPQERWRIQATLSLSGVAGRTGRGTIHPR
jgi:hypothetical protein